MTRVHAKRLPRMVLYRRDCCMSGVAFQQPINNYNCLDKLVSAPSHIHGPLCMTKSLPRILLRTSSFKNLVTPTLFFFLSFPNTAMTSDEDHVFPSFLQPRASGKNS